VLVRAIVVVALLLAITPSALADGDPAPAPTDAGVPLDDDPVAVFDELIRGGRQQPDAMLLRFDFLGDADDHVQGILTELRN